MKKGLLHKSGQYVLEYALLIAVVIAALLSIQAYFKRGIQGSIKDAADTLGEEYSYDNMKTRSVVKQHQTAIIEVFDEQKRMEDIGVDINTEIMAIDNLENELE